MSDLVTGEAVPLEMRLAKFPTRALAIAIDLGILLIGGIFVAGAVGAIASSLDDAAAAAIAIATVVLVLVGVPTTVETLTRGKSLGKLALGLRVVRDDGGPIRFRHALVRALAGVFVDFYLTTGAGAIICSILNERGKRVGDLLAGTVVVRERVPTSYAPLPNVSPELASWATTLELSQLPNDLAMAARNYLARGGELSPHVRDQMGAQLATEVSRLVTPAPPAAVPAWAYLAAVLGERRRRDAMRLEADRLSAAQRPGAAPSQPWGTSQPGGAPSQPWGTSQPGGAPSQPWGTSQPGAAPSHPGGAPSPQQRDFAARPPADHDQRPESADDGSAPADGDQAPASGRGFVPPA